MKSKVIILIFSTFLLLSWKETGTSVKHVDLVFCMDLSASTNGILNDVRNKMWNITNGILQKNDNTDLRIAVVGYGRPSFGSNDGYVRIISELTNDLDQTHYNLSQLKAVIEKGDQFVPSALYETFKQLKWSKDPQAEKMVFLIGNGSAYTGPINLNDVCEEYKNNNIRINSVYVLQNREIQLHSNGYKSIAGLTNGNYYTIHPSPKMVLNKDIKNAQMIVGMSNSLNSTCMFYSKDAADRKKFQAETDKNTLSAGVGYFYSRVFYKTSQHYVESYAPFDITSYILKYDKMPDHINYNYLMQTEKTNDLSVLEDRARKKAFARMKLSEEIKWIFQQIEKDSVSVKDSLLDSFVLGSYN